MSISQGRRQDVGSGGTSDKISFMNSCKVLYCSGVAKISALRDIQQKCTHQRLLKKILNFIKEIAQKFNEFSILLKIKFNRI